MEKSSGYIPSEAAGDKNIRSQWKWSWKEARSMEILPSYGISCADIGIPKVCFAII